MTEEPGDSATARRWRGRPVLALAVELALRLVPLAASTVVVVLVDRRAAAAPGPRWPWLGLALLAAVVTGLAVDRVTRRLLPYAVLLRLNLLFPGRAPSRFRVAREAVARSQERGPATPSGTAEHVLRLIGALGAHDRRTRGHCERVRVLTDVLAGEVGLTGQERDRLRWASLLHDLGKLEVPVRILNKPSRLSAGEFSAMQTHPETGAALAAPLLPWLGAWGLGIVEHHERYDGSGYPDGIAGDEISQAGRMVGLVDAFETMTAARPYKKAMATAAARAELARCAGTHFDPGLVRAFLAIPLPRLLWAMGPISFACQVPFLRLLAEAGRTSASAGAAAVPAAAGAAGAVAIAVGSLGAVDVVAPEVAAAAVVEATPLGPVVPVAVPAAARATTTRQTPPVIGPQAPPPATSAPVLGPVVPTTEAGTEPAAEPTAPVLGPVAPTTGPAGPVVPIGPVPVTQVTDPVLAAVTPVVDAVAQPVAPVTEPLAPVVGTVTEPLAPVVDAVTAPLAPVLDGVTAPLAPVVDAVTAPLAPVTEPLAPVLDAVTAPLAPVTEPLAPVLDTVTAPLAPLTDPLAPVLGPLPLF